MLDEVISFYSFLDMNFELTAALSVLTLVMISSGHSADRKIFKIAALNSELKTLKSDFIEAKKQLLVLRKETNVIRILLRR